MYFIQSPRMYLIQAPRMYCTYKHHACTVHTSATHVLYTSTTHVINTSTTHVLYIQASCMYTLYKHHACTLYKHHAYSVHLCYPCETVFSITQAPRMYYVHIYTKDLQYSTCVVLVYATLMKLCTGRGDLAGGDQSFLELVYIYTIYDVHNSDHFV